MVFLNTSNNNVLVSTNPAQGYAVLGEVAVTSPEEIAQKVAAARLAHMAWRKLSVEQRVDHMLALYDHLERHKDEFIKQTSMEMGMPLKLATAVTDGGFEELQWNIDHAVEALSNDVLYEDDREINEAVYEPYGVMACVLPWNFPFPNFARSPGQALLAGNAVVIKYSEEIPLFSKYLEELIASSNFPKDLVQFVYGDGQTGDHLTSADIDYISFTGSTKVGQHLYKKAAEKLIPVELELGGSSPGVIFADCELSDDILEVIFARRFINSGQFCSGLKRLIVHNSRFDEAVEKLMTLTQSKIVGDPLDTNTDVGPLVAERQLTPLEEQVKDALDKGAALQCGGRRIDALDGAFYAPTILTNITTDMRVWREEVFGPALPVIGFDSYDEAIELANDTDYGLSGFVFTQDKDLAKKAMMDIGTGSLQQNICNYQRPQNPFGGYKCSGIGRQRGISGFHHVSQIKVIAWEK